VSAAAAIAFLFPGQGSQRPGMLARLRGDAVANAVLAEAESILGRDLAELDSAKALEGTQATQLALLIAGVAGARQLESQGIAAAYVAGHSVGAFAAAVHARALNFDDALRLVDLRGRAMARAYPQGYGMAAIAGVPERMLQAWIDSARARGATLYLANFNAARQFTVSGAQVDLDALIEQARAHGANKAIRLNVATPSHSPLMSGVAAQLRAALESIHLQDARVPCAANRNARIVSDARAIADDLADGVRYPVLWHEISCALHERGVRVCIEMAPGDVLTRLAQAAFDDARAFALESTDLATLHRFSQAPA
jgi:malonate decarboxylase epsilon subunit